VKLFLYLLLITTSAATYADTDKWLNRFNKAKELVESFKKNDINTTRSVPGQRFNNMDIDYGFYSVNYNCGHRGFNYIKYQTVPDSGNNKRVEPFTKDETLPVDCPSQTTTDSYKKRAGQEQYHRGHGNHQNIWDHDMKLQALTNMMTNVVPHHGVQNSTGLWRILERRIECARDQTTVQVYLGNDWGVDSSNDHFVASHGVTTPDYLWRVHVYNDNPNQAYAWLIPNSGDAKKESEGAYRVTLEELKEVLDDDFDWPMPAKWANGKGLDPHIQTTCSWK
jgi:endonuclease G